jgi:hypothetical protein
MHAENAATDTADNEEQRDRPINQTRERVVAVVRPKLPTEISDEPMALRIGMPLPSMSPGTIRKPPPMPKKPEIAPTTSPIAIKRTAIHGVMRTSGLPLAARGSSIAAPTAIMASAKRNSSRANRSAVYAGNSEGSGARPFDIAGAPVAEQVGKCIGSNGKGAGTDGDMCIADADNVEQERYCQNRTPAADQSKREPYRPAGKHCQRML